MKNQEKFPQPPRWAQKLLMWYCRPSMYEDLSGDLEEYFHRHVREKGLTRARLIYIIDVFKFFRLYTIRKPEIIDTLIHWIMLMSYVKTSGRNIVRNKLFSFINIAGLSVSMMVGLILIAMLNDLLQYDRFHENHSRIYRVNSKYKYKGNPDNDFVATTSLNASLQIKETFTGVEKVAILQNGFSGDIATDNAPAIPLNGFWANDEFMHVFSFPLIQGNPATALREPFSVLLTEKSAMKIFGDTRVVGRTVRLDNEREFTVTGILKDIPARSHMRFDMLASLSTQNILEKDDEDRMRWDYIWSTWAYLLLPPTSDPTLVQESLDRLSEKEAKTITDTEVYFNLQPLQNIIMGENLGNSIGPVIGDNTIIIFAALTLVVILSACFNYTNLSIARSFSRSREIGIRKTIGALRSHVMMQFNVESVILSLLALAVALPLFMLVRPHFLSIEPAFQKVLSLELTPWLVAIFIAFAIVTGLLAGLFPAVFFSRLNTIQVLKSFSAIPAMRGLTLRKSLIVFQYCISIIAITSTVIFYKQYKHFISYDLGFNTSNILNLQIQGNNIDVLRKELSELPEVKEISQSKLITSIGNYWGTNVVKTDGTKDSLNIYYNIVNDEYLPLHGHTLIAGRNFRPRNDTLPESEIIVNEDVVKHMNLGNGDPQKAIDQVLKIGDNEVRVIGVLKNFQYGKANNTTNNDVVIRYAAKNAEYLNVRIESADWPETYSRIESIWKKIDPVHPMEAKFYNEQIEEAFQGLKAAMKVGGFLATLVVCIASIGLFGMVIFTTQTRMKEISIRKVLGASEPGLLYLLSRGFLILLIISGAIAIPLTYLVFEQFLLPTIANHLPVTFSELIIGFGVVMVVAIVMIGSHTVKVSRTNPADILKAE